MDPFMVLLPPTEAEELYNVRLDTLSVFSMVLTRYLADRRIREKRPGNGSECWRAQQL